jgi:hypothetical protein
VGAQEDMSFCLRLCRFVCSKDGWLGGGDVGGEEQQRLNLMNESFFLSLETSHCCCKRLD